MVLLCVCKHYHYKKKQSKFFSSSCNLVLFCFIFLCSHTLSVSVGKVIFYLCPSTAAVLPTDQLCLGKEEHVENIILCFHCPFREIFWQTVNTAQVAAQVKDEMCSSLRSPWLSSVAGCQWVSAATVASTI